jgi:Fe-S-cluster containining protein
MAAVPPVHGLTIHREWACRHSGACCTAGWPIPAEPHVVRRVTEAAAHGTLDLAATWTGRVETTRTSPDAAAAALRGFAAPRGEGALPEGVPLLATDAHGTCAFFEPATRLCAIHRQLGEAALPDACRHFPRVALLDMRGVSVSLSHYCPTAARLLLDPAPPLAIETNPPAFPPLREYEGLDATGALPPLLRPGVLHTPESYTRWEHLVVSSLAAPEVPVDVALGRIAACAEVIRGWTPGDGRLESFVALVASRPVRAATSGFPRAADAESGLAALASALPDAADCDEVANLVSCALAPPPEGWTRRRAAACRYVAARAFGSWVAYEGRGIRTAVRSYALAATLLQAVATRLAMRGASPADEPLFVEAVRHTDLLLVHRARPDLLRQALDALEALPLTPP